MKERLLVPTSEQTLAVSRFAAFSRHVRGLNTSGKIETLEDWEMLARAHNSFVLAAIDAGLNIGIEQDFRKLIKDLRKNQNDARETTTY